VDGEAQPRQTEVIPRDPTFLDRALYAIGIRRLYLEAVEELIRQERDAQALTPHPDPLPRAGEGSEAGEG
jgi:hypothetical protein